MSTHQPLVSIITASFNAAAFIEETILSVLNQDYPAIEHIVMDGGSTDGTVNILRRYPHLRWQSDPDRGQSHAINKGFRIAKGEVIAYLNADDTYARDAVSTAVSWLQRHPQAGLVYGDQQVVNEQGDFQRMVRTVDFELDQLFLFNEIAAQPAVFWRKRVLDEVGYLDENLHYAMDYDLWLRIALAYPMKRIPGKCLTSFRICPGTKTASHPEAWPSEIYRVLDKTLSSPRFLALPEADRKCCLASALRQKAYWACYQNQPALAAEYFCQASEHFPTLREHDVKRLLFRFAYCANSPLVPDVMALFQNLFALPLPSEIAKLKRKALSHVYFAAAHDSRIKKTLLNRGHLLRYALYAPEVLIDRSNRALAVKTLLGIAREGVNE